MANPVGSRFIGLIQPLELQKTGDLAHRRSFRPRAVLVTGASLLAICLWPLIHSQAEGQAAPPFDAARALS
jgi:hypothetical protein